MKKPVIILSAIAIALCTVQSWAQQSNPVLPIQACSAIMAPGNSSAWLRTDKTVSGSSDVAITRPSIPKHPGMRQPGSSEKTENNYSSFSQVSFNRNPEVAQNNKGYENDPELGVLYPDAPCTSCYELLNKRTETQKYFVKEGTQSNHFYLQSGSSPIHYKDANGKWRSINNHLEPSSSKAGVYATVGRSINVSVDTHEGSLTLSSDAGNFTYNRNLELIYIQPDGAETSLGKANWNNFIRGDDGMQVNNIWPGIDMQIAIGYNSVNTDFVVNHAMPTYAGGQLIIRDHIQPGSGLSIETNGSQPFAGSITLSDNAGNPVYQTQKAIAFEQNDRKATTSDLNYVTQNNNSLDIIVPGSLLNKAGTSYPIIIDPLVIGTSAPSGFTYSVSGTSYCETTNYVSIPAAATISDIVLTYSYTAITGAMNIQVNPSFAINGMCESSPMRCSSWTGTGLITGAVCAMTTVSFWSFGLYASWSSTGCAPAFSCSSYTLPIQLRASQWVTSSPSCSQTVVATHTPFTVDIEGTLSGSTPTISPTGPDTFCVGTTHTFSGSPAGGSWISSAPATATVSGSGLVSSVAAGSAVISYSYTGTCGTLYATSAVTNVVTPTVNAITGGTTSFCQGSTTTLTETATGGTWSSVSPGIATVGTGGIVTGVSAGTAVISYTKTNVCSTVAASKTVTVNALPAIGAITGLTGICVGTTTPYTDAVPGGTWTSGTPAVATVGSSSGSVHGVAAGTSIITYTTTNASCAARVTLPVTVSVTASAGPITGPISVCEGNTITLTGASPGGIWHTSDTLGAYIDTLTGKITGVWNGTYTITYTVSNACATTSATVSVTVGYMDEYHNLIATVAGEGISGSFGDGGLATDAQITDIWGITFDGAGNMYFVDGTNSVVRKVDASGVISLFAGYYGSPAWSAGDGGPAVSASLYGPSGIACDAAGNIYIGEYPNGNIRKVNGSGIITLFANIPSSNPRELSIDPSGNVYVTDERNARVWKIDPSGTVTPFAGTSVSGFSGDGGLATLAQLDTPTGVAADHFGNVYIADNANRRVRKVNSSGIISTVAGNGLGGYFGDNGQATNAGMIPSSLSTDAAGNVYVGEYAWSTVRKINVSNGTITRVAGIGYPTYSGDGMLALNAHVNPNCIAIDPAHHLYIGEYTNYRIRKVVNFLDASISGMANLCRGVTIPFSDTYPGGSWSSSDPSVASVDFSGNVNPISAGSATITYMLAGTCDTEYTTLTVTVNTLASPGTITGPGTVCATAAITLSDPATTGTWISSDPAVATVDGSGNVSGIAGGTAVISYDVNNLCGDSVATKIVTVNPAPDAGTITGASSVLCLDSTLSLTDTSSGGTGTWGSASSNVTVTGGTVTAVNMGLDTVTYSVTNSCGTAIARYPIIVNGCNVGVNPLSRNNTGFYLYPNPNPGRFTISFLSDISESADVVINNVVGERVKEFRITTNKDAELVLNLAPGVYFVTAATAQKSYTTKLIITE